MPWNTGSILKSKGSHAISQEKGKKWRFLRSKSVLKKGI